MVHIAERLALAGDRRGDAVGVRVAVGPWRLPSSGPSCSKLPGLWWDGDRRKTSATSDFRRPRIPRLGAWDLRLFRAPTWVSAARIDSMRRVFLCRANDTRREIRKPK